MRQRAGGTQITHDGEAYCPNPNLRDLPKEFETRQDRDRNKELGAPKTQNNTRGTKKTPTKPYTNGHQRIAFIVINMRVISVVYIIQP